MARFVDLDVKVSARSTFKYRKYQTPTNGDPSYMREFDLDVIPVLFSATILGREVACLNYDVGGGSVYPIFGAVLGVSHLKITNFRTKGLPASGGSSPFASFSAENQYRLRKNFTYTAFVGLAYQCHDSWSLASGYRWFDAGKFKGPRFLRFDRSGS